MKESGTVEKIISLEDFLLIEKPIGFSVYSTEYKCSLSNFGGGVGISL